MQLEAALAQQAQPLTDEDSLAQFISDVEDEFDMKGEAVVGMSFHRFVASKLRARMAQQAQPQSGVVTAVWPTCIHEHTGRHPWQHYASGWCEGPVRHQQAQPDGCVCPDGRDVQCGACKKPLTRPQQAQPEQFASFSAWRAKQIAFPIDDEIAERVWNDAQAALIAKQSQEPPKLSLATVMGQQAQPECDCFPSQFVGGKHADWCATKPAPQRAQPEENQ